MDIQEVQDRYEHKSFGTRFWLLPSAYPEGLNETQLGSRIRVWKPCQEKVIERTGPPMYSKHLECFEISNEENQIYVCETQ